VHALGFAILGLLARDSLSGYDIAVKLRRPIGFYWTARHSQIYPELRRLSQEGLVTGGEPDAVRRRRVYRITRSGRNELRKWVSTPPSKQDPHDEVTLRTYSIWMLEPKAAVAFYRQEETAHLLRLKQYRAMLATVKAEMAELGETTNAPRFGNYATLVRGIGYEKEYVAWCRWLIAQFDGSARPATKKKRRQRSMTSL
jgi:DNA-binding PadR family transcriptional regulator